MGTRHLTVFQDTKDGDEFAVMYGHWDGYPEGHGKDLSEFLRGKTLVNGISGDADRNKIFNGMNNLAAAVVAQFYNEPCASFHLYPAGTRDCWEEYIYTIYPFEHKDKNSRAVGLIGLKIQSCYGGGKVLYDGLVDDLNIESLTEDDEE